MIRLYKNARIVDIENERTFEADILTEEGKIVSFEKVENISGEIIDLAGAYVLPSFVNAFMDSLQAVEENYEFQTENLKENAFQLFLIKNLLAGATFFNDVSKTDAVVIENFEEKDEVELSSLSMEIARNKKRPFLKFGQDLLSLGSIDKKFGKSVTFLLEEFGFLDRNAIFVGGNCLEKDDLETLKMYGCDIVVLPIEDARKGRRMTNLVSLLQKGFEVYLGSGNCCEIDFFSFMRHMIVGMRSMFEDEGIFDEKLAFQIATNGKLLGIENKLEKGGMATFIVVDGRDSLYKNVLKTLVWERNKNDILMTIKDGEVLQKNGKIFMKNLPDYATIISGLKR